MSSTFHTPRNHAFMKESIVIEENVWFCGVCIDDIFLRTLNFSLLFIITVFSIRLIRQIKSNNIKPCFGGNVCRKL